MNLAPIEAIVRALLYEGYLLYPYRSSNVKNRQRWSFGGVYPRDHADRDESLASRVQTECLIRGGRESEVEIHVRFLHLVRREVAEFARPVTELPADRDPPSTMVASLPLEQEVFESWEEAVERDVATSSRLAQLLDGPAVTLPFGFAAERRTRPLRGRDGRWHGLFVYTTSDIRGELTLAATAVAPGIMRLSVRVDNVTPQGPQPDAAGPARWYAFASTHMILGVTGGAFVSLLDPGDLAAAAAACDNRGTWPVVVGEPGSADKILSSPIILYDYPRVAPESPGDLFDATEIDEILTLRILALTEAEKRAMAGLEPRARALLERTEALTAADMARLHGARRAQDRPGRAGDPTKVQEPAARTRDLAVGDRVHLRPKRRADIFDLALKDEVAIIEAIEHDFDDRVHVAVVLEADPGREFGVDRMPGHRFFFSPDELEPIESAGGP